MSSCVSTLSTSFCGGFRYALRSRSEYVLLRLIASSAANSILHNPHLPVRDPSTQSLGDMSHWTVDSPLSYYPDYLCICARPHAQKEGSDRISLLPARRRPIYQPRCRMSCSCLSLFLSQERPRSLPLWRPSRTKETLRWRKSRSLMKTARLTRWTGWKPMSNDRRCLVTSHYLILHMRHYSVALVFCTQVLYPRVHGARQVEACHLAGYSW